MKLRILGCGTSTGVPVIGCRCGVCASPHPRNKRTRASVLIETGKGGENVLIDTSTDLRAQALANGVERLDAVLFTHPHADHIHGIDELRSFNMLQEGPIPCYGNSGTINRIRVTFEYIFSEEAGESWKPNLTTTLVEGPFSLFGMEVTPLDVYHGTSSILGYRIEKAAYVTDCSLIPEESMEKLRGLDVLVLGALRHRPHPTHFSVRQALEAVEAIRPKRAVLTHLSHKIDYTVDNSKLPPGVDLAYDGMVVEVG